MRWEESEVDEMSAQHPRFHWLHRSVSRMVERTTQWVDSGDQLRPEVVLVAIAVVAALAAIAVVAVVVAVVAGLLSAVEPCPHPSHLVEVRTDKTRASSSSVGKKDSKETALGKE